LHKEAIKSRDDMLGMIDELLAKRDVKKVEVAIAKVLRSNPSAQERGTMLLQRARARLMGARPADAIDDLATARGLLPDAFKTPEVLELSGDCYFARFELAVVGFADRADTHQAQQDYMQVVEQHPDYDNLGWVRYQLGRIALSNNAVIEADRHFREAIFLPSRVRALTAYCYERLGFVAFYERRALSEALALVNKAADTYPVGENRAWLAQVHILRSRVLRDMRRYTQALAAAETALDVAASEGVENRLGLTEALLTAGELLAGLEGRERDVVNTLQQFLHQSKRPLGVDVTWSRVHEMLGDAYFKLTQYELASDSYLAALQFNPYHPWEVSLHYRIARSCYQQRNYEAAIRALHRMIAAAQEEGEHIHDYRVYDILGNAHFALRRYPEAVNAYQTALQMAPANADNLDNIRTYYQYAQQLLS
jgi:tetratricopeptide (TPR) repeat protein